MDITQLIKEFRTEKERYPKLNPAGILFSHLKELTDRKVQEFYARIGKESNPYSLYTTVEEIKHLGQTYQIISSAVDNEFIQS
ncbi:hypothetical protein HZC32_02405 [Candidatus Woesearchaeota archaeon]|nr:hypothetical protein [Candidatus Woesearchaeota archaeon]